MMIAPVKVFSIFVGQVPLPLSETAPMVEYHLIGKLLRKKPKHCKNGAATGITRMSVEVRSVELRAREVPRTPHHSRFG
jgi:hypothetical protein